LGDEANPCRALAELVAELKAFKPPPKPEPMVAAEAALAHGATLPAPTGW
jgi:hypothetical protein